MDYMVLTTSSFALLGLLSARPMSGYDLTVGWKRSVGQFWSLSRAGVYRELGRLERLGYVAATDVVQQRRPDKRIYEPTPSGHEAFAAWLMSGDVEDEGPKTGFLVKFFFARRMPSERVETLLDELQTTTERDLEALTAVHDELADRDEAMFERLTALHGIRVKEARLGWIAEARAALRPAREPKEESCSLNR
jgi:DNA-binding PadR family transcriptional regulator